MIKPKRGLDGKRNDRKNFRSGIKTRYDSFTSKSGFASSDSNCGGNNLLGMQSTNLFFSIYTFVLVYILGVSCF